MKKGENKEGQFRSGSMVLELFEEVRSYLYVEKNYNLNGALGSIDFHVVHSDSFDLGALCMAIAVEPLTPAKSLQSIHGTCSE